MLAEKIKHEIEKLKGDIAREETRLTETDNKRTAAVEKMALIQNEKKNAVAEEDYIRAAVGIGWKMNAVFAECCDSHVYVLFRQSSGRLLLWRRQYNTSNLNCKGQYTKIFLVQSHRCSLKINLLGRLWRWAVKVSTRTTPATKCCSQM